MSKPIAATLCLLLFVIFTNAQNSIQPFPQQAVNNALTKGFHSPHAQWNSSQSPSDSRGTQTFHAMELMQSARKDPRFNARHNSENQLLQLDTLIVGAVPNDTVIITGNWSHTGPIWVFNTGVLIFDNATVIDTGDVYVFGNGQLFADSSSFTFPQTYFYERSLLVLENAHARFTNCSFNYSGMSHSLAIAGNALVEMIDIHQNDWTTCALFGSPTLIVDGCNIGGEYILNDSSTAVFDRVDTLILWHQIPETGVINYAFPNGDTVYNYAFNNTVPGVTGLDYSVAADSCHNVMWALMPVNGSDVTISNSEIRLIGAWFERGDTTVAHGIFNNSSYVSYTTPLADRVLQLNNTTVETWSLYVFDSSMVTIDSCQLGEVGTQQKALINSSDFILDGSGGYFWATDTSAVFAISVISVTPTRSEKEGLFVLAYSLMPFTAPMAVHTSILISAQNDLVSDPQVFDGSVIWLGKIDGPDTSYTNANIGIFGSAWIDQGPLGHPIDFSSYSLYYQNPNVSTTWFPIVVDSTSEIRHNALGVWNTTGFPTGPYILKLVVTNNAGDSIDCLKVIELLPGTLNVQQQNSSVICNAFPNPATQSIIFSANETGTITIVNALGETMMIQSLTSGNTPVDISMLSSGVYFWTFNSSGDEVVRGQLIKK